VKIQELNKDSTAKFGLTKFADMEPEEFSKMNGFVKSTFPFAKPAASEAAPVDAAQLGAIDWVAKGMTTPVKNQQQCGSCWAFSATETVESANLLAGKQVPAGAPQMIVDCDSNDDGCNGGDPREALQWVQSNGLDTESCYPYTAVDETCASSKCSPSSSLTVSSVTPIASDENSIYTALTSSPLSICCDASAWQYYDSGILKADKCGQNIDHAIQLTGFSPNNGGYWIVRNSWGADWGEKGSIYLEYGKNTCGITSEVTAATA